MKELLEVEDEILCNLRLPGPTPCPPEVLKAISKPPVNHRSHAFLSIAENVRNNLQVFFKTKNDIVVFTGSGTGSMEAGIVNVLSPKDIVLALSTGFFGNRLADIATAFEANVIKKEFPWGQPVDLNQLETALAKIPKIKAVLITHNETSTGVTNDLEKLSKIAKTYGKLLIVDAVSSIPGIDLKTDEWDLDVVFSASQKGWMTPPGLSFMSMNKEAWAAYRNSKMPKYYFDAGRYKDLENPIGVPQTPAVSLYYGLHTAFGFLNKEGHDNILARHKELAEKTRLGIEKLGLELLAQKSCASDTVTAVKVPENLDANRVIKEMRKRKVVISGGMGKLAGKIIRIGHMGYFTSQDIDETLNTLEESIQVIRTKN